MKKMINKSHIEGLLYESTLEERVAGENAANPGAKYISGNVSVQVAEDNVITIDVFESEITKKKTANQKYPTLKTLMAAPSVVNGGVDNAVKVRIDSALALNDWYRPDGELVSSIRNFNGFIHIVTDKINPSSTFEVDMLIVSSTDEMQKNADGDMEPTGSLILNGYIFDYANKILPVRLLVENKEGVKYFRDLENNTFTRVWGNMITQTVKTTQVEKSAFGADKVVEYVNTRKKYVVTGVAAEPYDFGDESVLSVAEVKEALANREIYLADLKTRNEQARKKSGTATGSAPIAKENAAGAKFDF